jgi:transglycosylase-like protein with SLT domain
MENVIESYLVKLGFEISQPELNKFKGALKEAGAAAETHTSGIIGQFVKWQSAIVGAFAAVGLSTVAMMDKVADADLGYQKIALSMGMTTKSARELTIAQKVLGISIADANWNLEQRGRLRTLLGLERQYLEPGLAPDFETTMEHIRSISAEFNYMRGILVYISMEITDKLYKALGGDSFLAKLEHFTEWFAIHSKDISDWLARVLVPLLKDAEHVMQAVWRVAEKLAEAFVRIVGAISGDDSLRNGALTFDSLGKAIDKAADYMVQFVDAMTSAQLVMIDMVMTLADLVRGFTDLANLRFKEAGKDFQRAGHDAQSAGSDLTGGGAAIFGIAALAAFLRTRTAGGLVRAVGGAARAGAGGVIEGASGAGAGAAAGGIGLLPGFGIAYALDWAASKLNIEARVNALDQKYDPKFTAWLEKFLPGMGQPNVNVDPEKLAAAVAWRESGGHQIDPKTGRTMRSGAGALGIMQLMPGTAASLGVNPYDATQNMEGGGRLLAMLMQKYGNVQEVLAAYNWGETKLDAAIRRHGGQFSLDYLPGETQKYIRDIEGHMGGGMTVNVGGININNPHATPEQIKNATQDGIEKALRDQTRRQLVNAQARGGD